MAKLTLGRHYRILAQNTVFLACQGVNGVPVLKDLNKSNGWEFQGYQLEGDKLIPVLYELDTGEFLDRAKDCRPDVSLNQLRPCGVKVERIDLREWGTRKEQQGE